MAKTKDKYDPIKDKYYPSNYGITELIMELEKMMRTISWQWNTPMLKPKYKEMSLMCECMPAYLKALKRKVDKKIKEAK